MKLLQVVVPVNFNLFLFGDDHTGTMFRYSKGFKKLIEMMNSPYHDVKLNMGIHHGDIIEGILVDDKRYYPERDENGKVKIPSVFKQVDGAVKDYEPIRTKIKLILKGNHDDKLWRLGDITQEICNRLRIECGDWTAKVSWVDSNGKLIFKSYHTHGKKTITSTADDPKRRFTNRKLILKRHLKFKAGDALLMCKGHTHQLMVCGPEEELYLTDDGKMIQQNYTKSEQSSGYIHPDHRWYVNTGSFVRLYHEKNTGYAEKAEYDPIELGFAIAKIRDRKLIGIDKVVV